jgi:DNA-binding transcriptional LysR family regulator
MLVEAEHLITFAIVAKTGSLSEAAKALFKSQPAVSAQLKRLQDALGEPLYKRHRYGIHLTPTGQTLLPYAQTLLRSLEGARLYARELKEGSSGQLCIAASTTIAMYLLPKLLRSFSEKFSNIELKLITCNTQEAISLLKEGSSDLAMTEGPDEAKDLEHTVIAQDEIVLALPPTHPLAKRKMLKVSDLEGLKVVRREFGSGTRAVVDKVLLSAQVQPKTVLEAKGVDAVKEAILQGFGAGFLSRRAIEREEQMGLLKALPIDTLGLKRPLMIVHPRLELCSQNARRFIAFIEPE